MQTKINKNLLINDLDNISSRQNAMRFVKLFIALGVCVASFWVMGSVAKGSAMFNLLLVAGVTVACCLIFYLFAKSTLYYYKPTKSLIGSIEFFCKTGTSQNIISALKISDCQTIIKNIVKKEASTKVVIAYSKDKAFIHSQVFVYEKFTFEPASDIIMLDEKTFDEILTKIKK